MPTTVIMKTSRPDGAGGTYKQGSPYTLADDLAAYFLSIGAAKRTSTRSEQTGAAVSSNAAGQFPSAPALSSQVPVTASTPSSGGLAYFAGDKKVQQIIHPRASAGLVAIGWESATLGATTAGWTVTKDASNAYIGRTVLSITATAGAADTGTCSITIPSTYLGAFTRLGFPVSPGDNYVSGGANDYYPQLWINYAGFGYHKMMGGTPLSHIPGEWRAAWTYRGQVDNVALAQWTAMSAGPFTTIMMVLQKRAGQAIDVPLLIGPVLADPITEMKPTFTLFFDGNYPGQWDYARPIMQQYGLRASLSDVVPRVGVGGYLTAAQCDAMYALGHEHICHTGSGVGAGAEVGWDNTTKYPDGQEYDLVKADLAAFDAWAASRGYTRGRKHGVIGFTNGLSPTQTLARRRNIARALADSGYKKFRQLSGSGIPYYGDVGAPSLLTSATSMVGSTTPSADIIAIIDKVIARGTGWYGLTYHDVVLSGAAGNNVTAAELDAVCAYLAGKVAAGVINVLPFSEAMERMAWIPAPQI